MSPACVLIYEDLFSIVNDAVHVQQMSTDTVTLVALSQDAGSWTGREEHLQLHGHAQGQVGGELF